MVVAPEHPLIGKLTTTAQKDAVDSYIAAVRNKSDLERTDLADKKKTGVFTGSYAINPVNGNKIPVWTADYVLMSYGTGAIMAVPAHDTRDWEFAKQFSLPIIQVVGSKDPIDVQEKPWTEDGPMVNSGPFNGLSANETKKKITADLAAKGQGKLAVNFKLRDWLFSRQRYWGEPFPILWVSKSDYAKDSCRFRNSRILTKRTGNMPNQWTRSLRGTSYFKTTPVDSPRSKILSAIRNRRLATF
jgi:leucyl-tRNA synthetase